MYLSLYVSGLGDPLLGPSAIECIAAGMYLCVYLSTCLSISHANISMYLCVISLSSGCMYINPVYPSFVREHRYLTSIYVSMYLSNIYLTSIYVSMY
jgi:hypothetical protein